MKTALSLVGVAGFPYQLSLAKKTRALPIPPIAFTKPTEQSLLRRNHGDSCNTQKRFYYKSSYRVPKSAPQTHGRKKSKAWLGGPKMKYWPQQLTFAVFCATQVCGISRQIFDIGLTLPP